MPQVINPQTGESVEVTEAQLETQVDQVGVVVTGEVIDGPLPARLWDNISETWTLVPQASMSHYLQKVVFKCSACRETFFWTNQEVKRSDGDPTVEAHIKASADRYAKHKGAEVSYQLRDRETVQVCSGCGQMFPSRRDAGTKHLQGILAAGPAHRDAKEVVMLRFALAPPVSAPVPSNGHVAEPVTSQVEESQKRRRKRNRGRKRRGQRTA